MEAIIEADTPERGFRILSRVWRVGPAGSADGIMLDLATGKAYRGGECIDLWRRYQTNGRRLEPLMAMLLASESP